MTGHADPQGIVEALGREGFAEFKREVAQGAHGGGAAGGLWQGLDPRTGAVASVIWATGGAGDDDPSVFLDVNGPAPRSTISLVTAFAHDSGVRIRVVTPDE